MKTLVFGNGWLGNKFSKHFEAHLSLADIGEAGAVKEALVEHQPEVVINAAGKTGHPNIDWCEFHKEEVAYSNIVGPVVLAKVCNELEIKLVHLSSGCLWDQILEATEENLPDPPSFYSFSKAVSDSILMSLDVRPLILRLRMPICGEPTPRNLITKLAGYDKITDLPNSMTHVDDLIGATQSLLEAEASGIFNIVNPGVTNLPRIMDLYIQYVDPDHEYTVITKEELLTFVAAGRSDCTMSTEKLNDLDIYLPQIEERIEQCMKEYAQFKSEEK